jgi:hypothetical protein
MLADSTRKCVTKSETRQPAKVHAITGYSDYTIRQAAHDLPKLRSKHLVVKPGHSRRYHTPPQAARTMAALLALRA